MATTISTPARSSQQQEDLQRKQLEQQLSATRRSLRQANIAVEEAKTEREKVHTALNTAMEQLRETTTEMQHIKAELVKTRNEAKTEREKVHTVLNATMEQLRKTTIEMQNIKTDWVKTKNELADTKAQLQAVSSKAEQNTADVNASKAATNQLTETSQLLLKLVLKTTRHSAKRIRKKVDVRK